MAKNYIQRNLGIFFAMNDTLPIRAITDLKKGKRRTHRILWSLNFSELGFGPTKAFQKINEYKCCKERRSPCW